MKNVILKINVGGENTISYKGEIVFEGNDYEKEELLNISYKIFFSTDEKVDVKEIFEYVLKTYKSCKRGYYKMAQCICWAGVSAIKKYKKQINMEKLMDEYRIGDYDEYSAPLSCYLEGYSKMSILNP